MKKTHMLCSILMLAFTHQIKSVDALITVFLAKYPYPKKSLLKDLTEAASPSFDAQKYSRKLQQPDYVYRKISKSYEHTYFGLPGVMCMYGGQVALSNPNGQITFPRAQQTQDMYVLISKGIKPAYIVAPGTVHNWILDPKQPAEMYLMSLKHDQTTTLYYYETKKVPLPHSNNIQLNTLIFIADPSTIYIPLGATVVDYSPNIILPTIYIKKNFCFVYNSFYSLAVKQYFRQTEAKTKQDIATIAQIQQNP